MEQETLFPLLCGTAQGRREDFAELYKAASPQVFAVVLKLLRHRELAEEATQDAFIKVWHNAASYQMARGTVLTWIISIARYRALDMLRYQRIRKTDDTEPDTMVSDDDNRFELEAKLSHPKLEGCLDELDTQQRQAIHLAYFNGLSHLEVVEHLSSPLGTIKSWIRRGLVSLQRCLSL
ncbi:sigma-70 family RNA polymerase sigma factor [Alteromonas sp. AMM-1]|uniref:sigma-70 family RNA polymerase sigma factor n=1 Tax=Alteromonas sp. AMM-1 TaxID=3394233 RepID=UPI0039A4570C